MDYKRLYVLLKLSESLSDEERAFLAGRSGETDKREIMAKLDKIDRQGSFGRDFLSNVSGNAAFDLGVLLLHKLFRKLR